ncbi:hypothetical protein Patl1_36096 [Pistacia atlantica]|nr:hypothetical protein Patl1_36096 [Pistacia atlantica]
MVDPPRSLSLTTTIGISERSTWNEISFIQIKAVHSIKSKTFLNITESPTLNPEPSDRILYYLTLYINLHPTTLWLLTNANQSKAKQANSETQKETSAAMAATLSSPWAKPGAWALDAEEHEAELQQQKEEQDSNNEIADFPSLATAAATKTKKKKGQTLSLAEFNSVSQPTQPSRSQGLTHEDLLALPTWSPEDSSGSRWGSSRVSNRDSNRESQSSRADEIDNWAAEKKSARAPRSGGFFDSQSSKADESDSWVSNKTETRSRFGFNSGGERKSSFDSLSRDRDRDNWGKKREESSESERPRPRLVLQPRTMPVSDGGANVVKPKGVNPFGEARPREQVLAEKGMDPKEIEEKLEAVKIKEEKADTPSFGRRGFGNGRGGFNESRSWRKNDSDSVDSTIQSAEETENGHSEVEVENGHTEEKHDNGHVDEN